MTSIGTCVAVLSLLGATAGCTGAQRPVVSGPPASPHDDPGVVAAALGFFAVRTEGVLQVDPRPLRPDASLQGIRARDLDGADEGVIRGRRGYLARRGVRATDAAADMRCAFSRGVLPPDSLLRLEPDSIRSRREACLARGLYTTYAFGVARPVSASGPAGATLRVRAYRITTWSFEVWDVDLRPKRRGYEVIGAHRLGGVAS